MRRLTGALPLALMFFGCVPGGGGGGGGGEGGDRPPADSGAGDACVPSCAERSCGDDGCGSTCGTCAEDQICSGTGVCLGVPATCGDEVCSAEDDETCETCPADCGACCGDGVCTAEHGEHCGTCPADCGCGEGETCDARRGVCEAGCARQCDGRECGDDGCGDVCGVCAEGEVCQGDGSCALPPEDCGDGACADGEDCSNCPADCGCAAGLACRAGVCECVPDCGGAECGDDGCGGSCGACPGGEACAGGECVAQCAGGCGDLWAASCTEDGFGVRLCTPDPDAPGCTVLSRRVPCGEGRECGGGQCAGACVRPEVLLLVDRSSSMIGERWQFTRQTLIETALERQDVARLGLRTFPGTGDGCAAGRITAPAFGALNVFQGMPEPAEVAQTPIAAAFDGAEVVFGDPDEGESIILLTDGDETCEDELAAVQRVEALRRRGIRTFAVGISRQANGELLSAIAEAGGTARAGTPYYVVDDAAQLAAALGDIFTRIDSCLCEAGERRCNGVDVELCAGDGRSFARAERCDVGCDAGTSTCFAVCDPTDETPLCQGDALARCNARGDDFDVVRQCANGCGEGVGCFPLCRPGSRRCDGAVSLRCVQDGSAYEAIEMCDGLCDLGTGQCGGANCAAGIDARCGPGGLEVCDDRGAGFELVEPCACNPETARCLDQPIDGALRLVGVSLSEGRLEVYHDAVWGTVCDDVFGVEDERVACNQLGYPDRFVQFDAAGGAGQIWMDQVSCVGNERRLADCPFNPWGNHDCGHNEDVGLSCLEPEVGQAYCVVDESWYFLGDGVVRRAPCPDGCLEATGLCVGAPPPGNPVALPANECFAHHGSCGSWNDCDDAEGCANQACAFFGHGPALQWSQVDNCVQAGIDCRPYNPGTGDYEHNFNGCDLPAACDVVCQEL